MKFRTLAITIASSLTLVLTAWSKHDATHGVNAVAPSQILDTLVEKGKGFTAGATGSTTVVYALFDPSCGHCAALWQASKSLVNVKFVWIPVSIMRPHGRSTRQGAALLTSPKAVELMDSHEASVLAGTGGLSVENVTPESEAAIEANTKMFADIGLEGVPFIVAKNAKTGQVVTNAGAMTTAALAAWLGVDGL
jgi:thiol:disulfide interchange protein DsbG